MPPCLLQPHFKKAGRTRASGEDKSLPMGGEGDDPVQSHTDSSTSHPATFVILSWFSGCYHRDEKPKISELKEFSEPYTGSTDTPPHSAVAGGACSAPSLRPEMPTAPCSPHGSKRCFPSGLTPAAHVSSLHLSCPQDLHRM